MALWFDLSQLIISPMSPSTIDSPFGQSYKQGSINPISIVWDPNADVTNSRGPEACKIWIHFDSRTILFVRNVSKFGVFLKEELHQIFFFLCHLCFVIQSLYNYRCWATSFTWYCVAHLSWVNNFFIVFLELKFFFCIHIWNGKWRTLKWGYAALNWISNCTFKTL